MGWGRFTQVWGMGPCLPRQLFSSTVLSPLSPLLLSSEAAGCPWWQPLPHNVTPACLPPKRAGRPIGDVWAWEEEMGRSPSPCREVRGEDI